MHFNFGTAGKPHNSDNLSTAVAVERIHELGLGCMEIEFVRGVQIGENKAVIVGETAKRCGVKLSAHAPYYINLNSREPEKIKASQARILHSARIASLCEARSVIVHLAFFMGDTPEEAYPKIKHYLKETIDVIHNGGMNITIRPEVMGKNSQFGTVEEVLNLCSELEGTAPCIDFAHVHAATGMVNSYPEFTSILNEVEKKLGRSSLDDMHLHCSGIQYGPKGEQKHLNMEESDFNYRELLTALKDYNVKGLLICESPNLQEDALLMQNYYHSL